MDLQLSCWSWTLSESESNLCDEELQGLRKKWLILQIKFVREDQQLGGYSETRLILTALSAQEWKKTWTIFMLMILVMIDLYDLYDLFDLYDLCETNNFSC